MSNLFQKFVTDDYKNSFISEVIVQMKLYNSEILYIQMVKYHITRISLYLGLFIKFM